MEVPSTAFALGGLMAGFLVPHLFQLLGWAGNRHIKRIDSMEAHMTAQHSAFNTRLSALERDSITRTEFSQAIASLRATVESGNTRVHARLDETNKSIQELVMTLMEQKDP